MEMLDRYRGSLLGLAVGDALGAAVEFQEPGTFAPVLDMRGGGPFGLEAGYWTDDTSMALCLAESFIECGEFDPADQMRRYCRWYRDGHLSSNGRCFDIGNTVASALRKFEQTGEPYSGSQCKHAAGNGSLMRMAPVPLFYAYDPDQAVSKAALSSRTTHGAKPAIDACRYLSALIWGALHDCSKESLLSTVFEPYPGFWHSEPLCEEVRRIAEGSFHQCRPDATGYSVDCLEAALWAFSKSPDFRCGALAVVNLGDDSDTAGAVYGQLAGAFYGARSIPPAWLLGLAKYAEIDSFVQKLYAARPLN